jgi:ABC-type transport system involved in multi-copper enzyme maturation permease subunit
MSANPAVMESAAGMKSTRNNDERIEIPARWRVGQGVVIALILLLAVWYNTVGWKSGGGESGVADRVTLFDQVGFLILIGLTWLTTPVVGTIAMTTWQEALRRRWMTALLAFGLVMLGLSTFFTWMQPGEEEKFLRDFGIGFIIIMTLLMAIFLGVALVPPDVERRTIFTILSKPVNRLEFLLGKFLGLCLTLAVNLALMGFMFLLSYAIFQIRRQGWADAWSANPTANDPGLTFELVNQARAMLLHFGQLTIMAALALTLSLVISGITAIVFCFLAYFGGQTSSYWEHLGGEHAGDENGRGLSGPVAGIVKVVYYMLPRLDRFDVRERLVNDMAINFNYIWKAFGSGLIYVAVLLTIAYLVFSDREF